VVLVAGAEPEGGFGDGLEGRQHEEHEEGRQRRGAALMMCMCVLALYEWMDER